MKPKDLKRPFSFQERRPFLEDSIFYVPPFYDHSQLNSFPSFTEIFGNHNPICIEYCAGNGDWLVERALNESNKNWIAVEKRFDRVRKIWAKMKNHALQNMFIICGEALTYTSHYLPQKCLEEVFINFPDPWPKKRHAKHRLIAPLFLDELARTLMVGKQITFVTDDQDYLGETLGCFQEHSQFTSALPSPFFVTDAQDYGSSWFERLWKEKGKRIYHTQFIRT